MDRQALALDAELKAHGGQLSAEQHRALTLACSDRGLVIIEGQAGTGKSTTLTAIARAHHTDGRRIIVTSTAALAAHRLATELQAAGAPATAYSTAGLHAALQSGRLQLGPDTTVIHDEAALASTREQHQLLAAVETSGARLITVGDPRQNQAVGAGGLWPDLEHAATENGAHVSLTRIVRATDPVDRRDQTRFRSGQADRALAGYGARGRVHLAPDQRQAEDAALDAAHADRQAGRRTIVICQTANEHLDQLNARAQAIRHQHGELGDPTLPVAGRPYGLRFGDEIQIRRPLDHPDLNRIANGTTGHVLDVDDAGQAATLRLADGRQARFTQAQVDQASVRLAYVQHPFPAQGHTTDTTHLLVAEHATQEGSYVALTRARHATHIHATHHAAEPERSPPADEDPLRLLAERMSRIEPELASIRTPLAHEHHAADRHATETQPADPQADDERELADQLQQARAALRNAERVLASYPAEHERQHAVRAAAVDQLDGRISEQQHLAGYLRTRVDQLGLIARRRAPGRELAHQLSDTQARLERLADEQHQHRQAAADHALVVRDWHARHPDARQRLEAAEHDLDGLADREARRRLRHPGPHLTDALSRPRTPGSRQIWEQAALEIERYRARYQISPADPRALGPAPAGDPRQREHYQAAAAAIDHAVGELALAAMRPPPGQRHLYRPSSPDLVPPRRPASLHPGQHGGPSLGR